MTGMNVGTMKWTLAILISCSLLTAGCSDPVAPMTPTPVAPTITETFTGTLLVLGANTHQFTVQQVGGLKVSVTDVTPGAAISLGVGTQSLTSCTVISGLTAAPSAAPQISGTATVTGPFCVSVSDVGNLVESVTYTLVVQHS
jgi:hypothetical protein